MVEDGGYAPPTLACRARIFLIKLIPHRNLSSFTLYSVVKELSSFVAQLTGKTISSLFLAVNHLMQKIWRLLGGREPPSKQLIS